jgi:hypothetical protein
MSEILAAFETIFADHRWEYEPTRAVETLDG